MVVIGFHNEGGNQLLFGAAPSVEKCMQWRALGLRSPVFITGLVLAEVLYGF